MDKLDAEENRIMTFQEEIDYQMKKFRDAQFAESNQLTLGQIIEKCEAIDNSKQDAAVVFDFEYAKPTSFDSWRGIYAELALGFSFSGEDMSLSDFIESAKSAVDKTFSGYKGGDYTMTEDTPVWVANHGNSGHTAIVGVLDDGWQIVLQTEYNPT